MCFYVFFPSPEKLTFGCGKGIFFHSFWPTSLKHTSFCREFNCVYRKIAKKTIFHLSKEKKNTKPQTIVYKRKFCNFFKNISIHFFFFFNSKNGLFCAVRLSFVNEIKISILLYLWNCMASSFFRRAPKKSYIFYANRFLYVLRKNLETNYVWDLMVYIVCLEYFSLRWIIKKNSEGRSPEMRIEISSRC